MTLYLHKLHIIFRQRSVDSTGDQKATTDNRRAGEKLIEVEKVETGGVSFYSFII